MLSYLHQVYVVFNVGQGLAWEGVQGGQIRPTMLLGQHQHDLQHNAHFCKIRHPARLVYIMPEQVLRMEMYVQYKQKWSHCMQVSQEAHAFPSRKVAVHAHEMQAHNGDACT